MKQYIFSILVFLMISTNVFAQRSWSVELGAGNHSIVDQWADQTNTWWHLDAVIRKQFNKRMGLGLYMGYDNLDLQNFETLEISNTKYSRASLEAVLNLFEFAHLNSKWFTLLGHVGPGISWINTKNDEQWVPNLSGGITGLIKLSNNFDLKADWSTTAQLNQDISLDGTESLTNVGINGFVNNMTIGIVAYVGKGKHNKKEHHDWETINYERVTDTIIINNSKVVNNKPIVNNYVTNECKCNYEEYIFFRNDEFTIEQSGYNAILKIANKLKPEEKIELTGYASPPASDEYNQQLSDNRCQTIRNLFVSLGIDSNRIINTAMGEIDTHDSKNVELSRRVRIQIK